MSDVANRIKADILKRIEHLQKQDEEHLNEIMDLKDRLEKEEKKRKRAAYLLSEAQEELKEIEGYIQFKNK